MEMGPWEVKRRTLTNVTSSVKFSMEPHTPTQGFQEILFLSTLQELHFHWYTFSYLIYLAKISSTVLCWIKLVRMGILATFFILEKKKNTFSFLPLGMTLAVSLSPMVFIRLSYIPSIPKILTWKYVEYVTWFSTPIEMIIWVFFHFVNRINYIDGFAYVEPSLHPRNK